jgi:hypothetical protein
MGKLRKSLFLLLIIFPIAFSILLPNTLKAQPNDSLNSPPKIEAQVTCFKDWVSGASNIIQTTDGEYVFMTLSWSHQGFFTPSTVYKVDSLGVMQWNKTIPLFSGDAIIQTSDGGYEISGDWVLWITNPSANVDQTIIKLDSGGNIQWVQNATILPLPDLLAVSHDIHTSDGGHVYWSTEGTISKSDSHNNTQWVMNLTYNTWYGVSLNSTVPMTIFSVIETSDGALAILGFGSEVNNGFFALGKVYLIKTEAFLPPPSPTQLPTPIPTSITAIIQSNPFGYVVLPVTLALVAIAVAVLLYRRHRKNKLTEPKAP